MSQNKLKQNFLKNKTIDMPPKKPFTFKHKTLDIEITIQSYDAKRARVALTSVVVDTTRFILVTPEVTEKS